MSASPINAAKNAQGYINDRSNDRSDDVEPQIQALLARRRRINCSGGNGEDAALIRSALLAKQEAAS